MITTQELYKIFLQSSGVSTDTRSILPGAIFFALRGENFNANRFADQALKAGAAYAVIDDPEFETEDCILVEDSLKSLQSLAKHHRAQLEVPVIGLTGSNGKTTTKELMAAVLSQKYKTAYTKGNLNNHIGVPLSLLSVTDMHEIAIIEMGANHQKEIDFLCSICRPDYGYITNFGKSHLQGFGGVEGVIKGKSELYDFLRKTKGKSFVNADDPKQLSQSAGVESISFGKAANAAYTIELVEDPQAETVAVKFDTQVVKTHLAGKYNYSNIGAAIAVGQYFDVDRAAIGHALENYAPQNNRSQITKTTNNKLVIDAYNANPSSTEAAIHNFTTFPGLQKWVILGDMFELGEYSLFEHQKIADLALSYDFEKVILVGQEYGKCQFDQTHKNLVLLKDTDNLLGYLQTEKVSSKTILIKGSRGMKMERALTFL